MPGGVMDWVAFLTQYNVDFITEGPNLAHGNVGVRCPFCGDDPSYHMGISLDGHGWNCWRNGQHRGRSPIRLIQALTGVSREKALAIAGHSRYVPEDFLSRVRENMGLTTTGDTVAADLRLPGEFLEFDRGRPTFRPF